MDEKRYSKDDSLVKQKLSLVIKATSKEIFHYLATTEGISTWFPQLSIKEEDEKQAVFFDMGDGTFEKMKLLDYKTDEHISYEWAAGKIKFTLEDAVEGTTLVLEEELPANFNAVPEDFTGWYVQMLNIQSVAETGFPAKLNFEEIMAVKKDIQAQLGK